MFLQCKKHYISYIGVIILGWRIYNWQGGDGIREAGVGAGERCGGDADGTRLAAGTVAGEGSTGGDGGTRAEDFSRSCAVCRSGRWGVSSGN